MTNPINYYYTNSMMNLFLETPASSDSGVTFSSIGSQADFWEVMNGPVLDSLYWETWYNQQNATPSGFIYYDNKLLGVPRLRQMRVRKGSCNVHPYFRSYISDCYDTYSYLSEDQTPYGPYLNNQNDMTDTAFFYQSYAQLQAPIVSGQISTYGGGGYVKNLATTSAASSAIMQGLFDNLWTDRGTRAVFLDFTIYNANINLFCQVRLTTEFPPTGGALPSWSFRTVKLIRYVTALDYFVMACEIIFCLFIAYYTVEEAIEIYVNKFSYFKNFWNCLDVAILLISYIGIIFNIYRAGKVSALLDNLLANSSSYPEFDYLAYCQSLFNYAIAITAFCCWIKIFKYVSFNKTMSQLSSTLGKCARDVLGFAVMFYIVFFAYAQLGYLLFGPIVPDYSTFTTTMFTLFRIILGDFDFPTLQAASPILGPSFFLSYVFFVFFVLLNMFLAIINDTYSEVKSDIDSDSNSESDQFSHFFKSRADKVLTKLNLKKDKIVDLQNTLANSEDKDMNYEQWRQELRGRGYSDVEIEAYFSQYDKDGDRVLGKAEQEKMRHDLAMEQTDLDSEIKRAKENADRQAELEAREEADRKANNVSHPEFKILTMRVDTMESSIGNIVNRIDSVLSKLESIERTKLKRRENMAKILDKLNDANQTNDEIKRAQLQKMVKDELDKWDEPINPSPVSDFSDRAASPSYFNSSTNLQRGKNAFLQQ
jgi:polycystin 2